MKELMSSIIFRVKIFLGIPRFRRKIGRRRRVLKYHNNLLSIVILIILFNLCFTISYGETNRIKVKDLLMLKDNFEITINEIHYQKENIARQEKGDEIVVNINYLKDMFLNNAVVISGMEMNYSYLYEYVTIVGKIVNEDKSYEFNYNLAGFGDIYSNEWKSPVIYGDISKELPPPFREDLIPIQALQRKNR